MPPEETPTLISELVHRIRSTDSYQEAIETSMRLVELGPACIPELLKELSGLHNKEWKKSLEERDWLLLQILGDIGSASVIPTLEESLKHMVPKGNQPEQVAYWQLVWTLVQCGSFSHFQHAFVRLKTTFPPPRFTLRFCFRQTHIEERYVEQVWGLIQKTAEEVGR